MKRKLLSLCFVFFVLIIHAQTKIWNGAGDGSSWNDPVNWSPAGVPGSTDNVLLDNSFVAPNYTVNLPAGNVSVSISSLIITPSATTIITLVLPNTNTSGTAFTATGAGDAVVLNKGANFINSSGAASGTPVSVTTTNYFRINNGGRYIHNTARGHTTNLASRLSTVPGTEKGIFEFDVPVASFVISLSGRTYGSMVLSSTANGGSVTYSGNGATALNINGDLQINTGVNLTIGMTGDFIVHGNYDQATGSTFILQNSSGINVVKLMGNISARGTITETGTGLPVLEMNGTVNQDVSVTGAITNSVTFRMNNTTGITLLSPLTLPYSLVLQNGKVRTDAVNILSLADNATATGGSSTSFVDGPMEKAGDDNTFSFPVGKGSIYAPISFNSSTAMALTDVFKAEYFRSNPQTTYGINYESPIEHVSYVEYWDLEKTAGTIGSVNVTLPVTQYSFAKQMNTLYVARYNTADMQWKNHGAAATSIGPASPPYVTGTITSNPVGQLGVFTLATDQTEVINPLPVSLILFEVKRTGVCNAQLSWKLADYSSGNVKFELQRSYGGNDFIPFVVMSGSETKRFYNYDDYNPSAETTYYRLKITNADGTITYSRVVLLNTPATFVMSSISPNPVRDRAIVTINMAAASKINFIIYDASGKTIKQWNESANAGMNNLSIETGNLKQGCYILCAENAGLKSVLRFVKL